MGVGAGLYMYDAVVKSSRSLSHLLMSSCINFTPNIYLYVYFSFLQSCVLTIRH